MSNTLVEITGTKITAEYVELTASAIEEVLMAEDLFETYEVPQVRFSFDRKERKEMLYLFKLVTNKSNQNKSLGERIEALEGKTISISPNFQK